MVTPLPLGGIPPIASRGNDIIEKVKEDYKNLLDMIFPKIGEGAAAEATQKGKISNAITRNLTTPLTASNLEAVTGTAEQQMTNYRNFDSAYRRAIQAEIDQGVMNGSKKISLQRALNPNSSIDLNLISNISLREELRNDLHQNVLHVKKLVTNRRLTRTASGIKQCNWEKSCNVSNIR